MTRQVLVIEDHQDIRNLLALHLHDMDCHVTLSADGTAGLNQARGRAYDLIVLDWILPGISGIEICRDLRRGAQYTPILMLTANTLESDRVSGLDAGADDYLTKPFSIPEFLARVRAIFRRTEAWREAAPAEAHSSLLRIKELCLDESQRVAHLCSRQLDLTAKEFDLLLHFARHPGQVFTRQQLLDAVWAEGFDGYEHTVNSHINRLRAKMEKNHGEPEFIVTVWGVGYKMPDYRCH